MDCISFGIINFVVHFLDKIFCILPKVFLVKPEKLSKKSTNSSNGMSLTKSSIEISITALLTFGAGVNALAGICLQYKT